MDNVLDVLLDVLSSENTFVSKTPEKTSERIYRSLLRIPIQSWVVFIYISIKSSGAPEALRYPPLHNKNQYVRGKIKFLVGRFVGRFFWAFEARTHVTQQGKNAIPGALQARCFLEVDVDSAKANLPQKEMERRHNECLRSNWKRLFGSAPFPLDQ